MKQRRVLTRSRDHADLWASAGAPPALERLDLVSLFTKQAHTYEVEQLLQIKSLISTCVCVMYVQACCLVGVALPFTNRKCKLSTDVVILALNSRLRVLGDTERGPYPCVCMCVLVALWSICACVCTFFSCARVCT